MPITLDGSSLTIEKLVVIARFNEKVELAPAALVLFLFLITGNQS